MTLNKLNLPQSVDERRRYADVKVALDQSVRDELKLNVSMQLARVHYGRSCLISWVTSHLIIDSSSSAAGRVILGPLIELCLYYNPIRISVGATKNGYFYKYMWNY